MKEEKLTIMQKISVKSTLLAIPVGTEVYIKTRIIKASSIRSAIRILNNKGYHFQSSERGLIDEVKVIRIK